MRIINKGCVRPRLNRQVLGRCPVGVSSVGARFQWPLCDVVVQAKPFTIVLDVRNIFLNSPSLFVTVRLGMDTNDVIVLLFP